MSLLASKRAVLNKHILLEAHIQNRKHILTVGHTNTLIKFISHDNSLTGINLCKYDVKRPFILDTHTFSTDIFKK